MKYEVIIGLSLLIILMGTIAYCSKSEPKEDPLRNKVDSLKKEIVPIKDSLKLESLKYEKTCSIIHSQSFYRDSVFFSEYLKRFRLHHDSGRVEIR